MLIRAELRRVATEIELVVVKGPAADSIITIGTSLESVKIRDEFISLSKIDGNLQSLSVPLSFIVEV